MFLACKFFSLEFSRGHFQSKAELTGYCLVPLISYVNGDLMILSMLFIRLFAL